MKNSGSLLILWWGRRDLNSHGLPHMHLKHARIPIPPRPHKTALSIVNRVFQSVTLFVFVYGKPTFFYKS